MNKKELIQRASELLRQKNIKKVVPGGKTVLHISDDNGNSSDFVVKKAEKTIIFNIDDLTSIMDAFLYVVEDALKHGEEVSIHGFGSLGLKYRQERSTFHPDTKERCVIDGHYTPKFISGKGLKLAAKVFELSLDENQRNDPDPRYDDYDADGDE